MQRTYNDLTTRIEEEENQFNFGNPTIELTEDQLNLLLKDLGDLNPNEFTENTSLQNAPSAYANNQPLNARESTTPSNEPKSSSNQVGENLLYNQNQGIKHIVAIPAVQIKINDQPVELLSFEYDPALKRYKYPSNPFHNQWPLLEKNARIENNKERLNDRVVRILEKKNEKPFRPFKKNIDYVYIERDDMNKIYSKIWPEFTKISNSFVQNNSSVSSTVPTTAQENLSSSHNNGFQSSPSYSERTQPTPTKTGTVTGSNSLPFFSQSNEKISTKRLLDQWLKDNPNKSYQPPTKKRRQ